MNQSLEHSKKEGAIKEISFFNQIIIILILFNKKSPKTLRA